MSAPDNDDLREGRRETWEKVFQIVSDHADLASREFIKLLEAAREEADFGPKVY